VKRPAPAALGKRPLFIAGAAFTALALLVVAGVVIKVLTADGQGVIVLEDLPDGAQVLVDGQTVTLKTADGKTFEIRVAPGKKHQLQVKKEGFKLFGEEVAIEAGGRQPIRVRLEPEKPLAADPRPPDPQPHKAPPREYDHLARGRWVAVLSSEDDFNRLLAENVFQGNKPRFAGGILECSNCRMSFLSLRAKDAVVRALAKKVETDIGAGINVSLALRDGNRSFLTWTFAVFAERGDASASRRPGEDKRGTPYP
jgi:PEGA domain